MADELAMDRVARRKAGNIDGWQPYYYEAVSGGLIVKGCMTYTISRGPRKGELGFKTSDRNKTVVITATEIKAEERRMAREKANG